VNKRDFKILIAEDDEMVRDVIEKLLTEEGYSVVIANDGLEAVKMLRMENICLVLTDLRMPGADGMEVLRTAVQVNPKTSVVILTAYGTLDTALEAMKAGAYDYIVKPFVMQQLILVVRNAFNLCNLFEENDELKGLLRKAFRDLENIRLGNGDNSAEIQNDIKILEHEESETVKEGLVPDSENLKRKYGSLLNDLKEFNE
jgi:DNA-binding NtrC family response regulator